ncbi:hypothetical protein LTR35_018108, partial [Friedmanniomyces endolithicus]
MTVSIEAASMGAATSVTLERLYRWIEARRSKGTKPPMLKRAPYTRESNAEHRGQRATLDMGVELERHQCKSA